MAAKSRQEEAQEFLKKRSVGVLATVDPNCEPHATVIYYVADRDSNIFFLTKSGTKKADNLEHKNHAMMVVYDASTQTTVQVTGETVRVEDATKTNDIFADTINASLETSGKSVPPLVKLKAGDYVAFQLKPKQIRMAEFGKHKQGHYEEIFKTTEK